MAATNAVLTLVKPGAARRRLRQRLRRHPPPVHQAARPVRRRLRLPGRQRRRAPSTRRPATSGMLWIETPTNPLMKICDIAALAAAGAPARGAAGRGQHLHEPVLPAPARAGRRHRGPLHHQVPERPLRQRGRRRGGQGSPRTRDWLQLRTRTPRARSSRPSTPGWCCAAPRRWRCACRATSRTGGRWRSSCAGTRKVAEGLLAGLRRPPRPRGPQAPGHAASAR